MVVVGAIGVALAIIGAVGVAKGWGASAFLIASGAVLAGFGAVCLGSLIKRRDEAKAEQRVAQDIADTKSREADAQRIQNPALREAASHLNQYHYDKFEEGVFFKNYAIIWATKDHIGNLEGLTKDELETQEAKLLATRPDESVQGGYKRQPKSEDSRQ